LDFEHSNNFVVGVHSIESLYRDIEKQQVEISDAIDTIKRGEDEKNNLIAQLSHDIRTPLNSIMGFLNLAGESKKNDDKDYYIRMATEACDNMALVMNNVIDLVSPAGDNIIINKQDRTIKKLLNQVLLSTNDMAQKIGLDKISKPSVAEEDKNSSKKALDGKRILLVEDTEANAMVTGAFLQEWGVETMRAHDGKEAVDIVSKSPLKGFDLILMDVQMPNMDGYEATKIIRNMPNKTVTDVPIIALTASVFEEDKKAAKEAGMNAHLSKPVKIPELLSTIKNFLKSYSDLDSVLNSLE